ncbi:MAG TPA: GNAT family N-acetyltransferase, partial [Acidimicrobiia bacterium]|nr:GNAT family N-acetyltransferase [Acidimicrobiia bacterium]
IYSIYVHPDQWGDGHGHDLLQAGEDTLLAKGFESGLLWVLDANQPARRFYERHGWTVGKPIRVEEIGGVQVTEVRYDKSLTAAP